MNPSNQYHGHIYFDISDRGKAFNLRTRLGSMTSHPSFSGIEIGRLHDKPVGPHTKPMFSISFPIAHFTDIVAWLMVNRNGLDILVHPITGDDLADHTIHPLWLGNKVILDTSKL